MKKVALLGSVLALAVAMTGCKSEAEKFADEICACKDSDCMEKVVKALMEKHKDDKDDAKQKDSDADKKASERAQACMKDVKK
jgi:hypothetical protein